MEAVLTNEIDDFFYCISKRILSQKLQEWIKDKHLETYIYTEILFQLITFYFININEDRFMIKIFTNEKCESNLFEGEENMEYLLMKLFTSS